MTKFSFRRKKASLLGTLSLRLSKIMYSLKITNYIYISVPEIYNKGYDPNFDLIKKLTEESELTIAYPHFVSQAKKKLLKNLAGELSKNKNRVVVYEISAEAGGGPEVTTAGFIYQQFQPIIYIALSLLINVSSNFVYDLIKKIYEKKNNPVVKSQFTISCKVNNVRYNYVFDNLSAEEALTASRLIPLRQDSNEKVFDNKDVNLDVYLRYLPSKRKWVEIKI